MEQCKHYCVGLIIEQKDDDDENNKNSVVESKDNSINDTWQIYRNSHSTRSSSSQTDYNSFRLFSCAFFEQCSFFPFTLRWAVHLRCMDSFHCCLTEESFTIHSIHLFLSTFFPCVSIAIQNMEEMEMEQKTEREERNEWMTKKHEIVHMVSWRKIGSLMTIIIFNMDVWRHCFVASFNSVYHWLKYDPSFHNVGSPECRSHHALSAHFFLY